MATPTPTHIPQLGKASLLMHNTPNIQDKKGDFDML
jgi:hypothetical protein